MALLYKNVYLKMNFLEMPKAPTSTPFFLENEYPVKDSLLWGKAVSRSYHLKCKHPWEGNAFNHKHFSVKTFIRIYHLVPFQSPEEGESLVGL